MSAGMSGNRNDNIKRSDLFSDSLVPSVGFKNIEFKHQATSGQTTIDTTALTAPALATANGFVQPTGSDLAQVNLKQFRKNLTLVSSNGGRVLQDFIDYVVTSSHVIELMVGAVEGEIFTGKVEANPRAGTGMVDARPLVYTGTLAAGQTDFNIGPYQVGAYLNFQHGSVMVFDNNQLVYRNDNNQAAGAGINGDYQEVPNIIRFNTVDLVNDRNISVLSIGALVEQPDGSQLAMLDTLSGQIDKIIEVLAAVSGQPESYFQAAANQPDLKAFGDRVLQAEADIDDHEARIDSLEHPNTYLSVESAVKTPAASTQYQALSGNALALTPGDWVLWGSGDFSNNAAIQYTFARLGWYGANGADSGAAPAGLLTLAGISLLAPLTEGSGKTQHYSATPWGAGDVFFTFPAPVIYVRVTAPVTVYLVTQASMSTAANARISVFANARKIGLQP